MDKIIQNYFIHEKDENSTREFCLKTNLQKTQLEFNEN